MFRFTVKTESDKRSDIDCRLSFNKSPDNSFKFTIEFDDEKSRDISYSGIEDYIYNMEDIEHPFNVRIFNHNMLSRKFEEKFERREDNVCIAVVYNTEYNNECDDLLEDISEHRWIDNGVYR